MRTRWMGFWMCLVGLALAVPGTAPAAPEKVTEVPVKGMVTMLDLGAGYCIPCKMMAPILEKLQKAYQGKAAIVYLDLRDHKEQAGRFKVRAIPTQVFFDAEGQEVFRHVGFMKEADIVQQLETMGVPSPLKDAAAEAPQAS